MSKNPKFSQIRHRLPLWQQASSAIAAASLLVSGYSWQPAATANPVQTAQVESRAGLSSNVVEAVFQDIVRRTNVSRSNLTIVAAERRDWPNGCLGLAEEDMVCTQQIVPGWQIIVKQGKQRWVYRTDESGSVVKLDTGATRVVDRSQTKINERGWNAAVNLVRLVGENNQTQKLAIATDIIDKPTPATPMPFTSYLFAKEVAGSLPTIVPALVSLTANPDKNFYQLKKFPSAKFERS